MKKKKLFSFFIILRLKNKLLGRFLNLKKKIKLLIKGFK